MDRPWGHKDSDTTERLSLSLGWLILDLPFIFLQTPLFVTKLAQWG